MHTQTQNLRCTQKSHGQNIKSGKLDWAPQTIFKKLYRRFETQIQRQNPLMSDTASARRELAACLRNSKTWLIKSETTSL